MTIKDDPLVEHDIVTKFYMYSDSHVSHLTVAKKSFDINSCYSWQAQSCIVHFVQALLLEHMLTVSVVGWERVRCII